MRVGLWFGFGVWGLAHVGCGVWFALGSLDLL